MKKYYILFALLGILVSCGKNEVKKEVIQPEAPIAKDTIVAVETIEELPTLVFTVQIAASKVTLKRFTQLQDVQTTEVENMIKYSLGSFTSYQEAKTYRKSLLNRYPGAFVQALKDGNPIHIKEAL